MNSSAWIGEGSSSGDSTLSLFEAESSYCGVGNDVSGKSVSDDNILTSNKASGTSDRYISL